MTESQTAGGLEHVTPYAIQIDRFIDFNIWPNGAGLNIQGWLANFDDDDKIFAQALLASFLYFSPELTDRLFTEAFRRLSTKLLRQPITEKKLTTDWKEMLNGCIITFPTGEDPSLADSGYAFVKKCRDLIGVREKNLMEPEKVVRRLQKGFDGPVIFVDDFCGTGGQFISTLDRPTNSGEGKVDNLGRLLSEKGNEVFYITCVSHQKGLDKIEGRFPNIAFYPANTVDESYSVFTSDGVVWPDDLAAQGPAWVERVSKNAGIPEKEMAGYRNLGLAIGFQHGLPDATIPLFHHKSDKWCPLKVRISHD